jgi:beta-galactosidase
MRNPGIYAAAVMLCALSGGASAQTAPYAPPLSPRAKLNFDLNWKFVRDDVLGAEAPSFDDSAWTTVGTPHTFNDVDSFRQINFP